MSRARLSGQAAQAISQAIGRPLSSVWPIISRLKAQQRAFASGASAQAKSQSDGKTEIRGFSPLPAALRSPEERSRVAALKLLAKVSREGLLGNRKFSTDTERKQAREQMEERVDSAKALIAKIKPPSADEDDSKATAYAAMNDEELADHVVTSACASLGIGKVREVLDRLEREGLLIKSPGEHAVQAYEVTAGPV